MGIKILNTSKTSTWLQIILRQLLCEQKGRIMIHNSITWEIQSQNPDLDQDPTKKVRNRTDPDPDQQH